MRFLVFALGLALAIAPAKAASNDAASAKLAVQTVQSYNVADLSFSDYEYILSYRDASKDNRKAADAVWKAVLAKQGKGSVAIPVKVISLDGKTLSAAITDDNQKANVADVKVTLKQVPASPPAPGTSVRIIGRFARYRAKPFLFVMQGGMIAEAAK
jgi:hypothetical protein